MGKNVDFQTKYTCHICNREIDVLTKKLQEHQTSGIWVRYGQCCAACVAPEDITGIHYKGLLQNESREAGTMKNRTNGDQHTNILLGLERAVEIEDSRAQKIDRCARRTVTTGRIIIASSLTAGFLFFYYEYFITALVCVAVCIGGLIVYRLGVKRCQSQSN